MDPTCIRYRRFMAFWRIRSSSEVKYLCSHINRVGVRIGPAFAFGPFVRKAASYTTLGGRSGHGRLTAPLRLRPIWSVGEDDDAGTEGPDLDQLQPLLLASLSEETLAAAHHDREDHEPIFIDQVQGHQAVDQLSTPENQHILPRLLLDPGDFLREIARKQAGVPLHF